MPAPERILTRKSNSEVIPFTFARMDISDPIDPKVVINTSYGEITFENEVGTGKLIHNDYSITDIQDLSIKTD